MQEVVVSLTMVTDDPSQVAHAGDVLARVLAGFAIAGHNATLSMSIVSDDDDDDDDDDGEGGGCPDLYDLRPGLTSD
jgi:hypothetical protein